MRSVAVLTAVIEVVDVPAYSALDNTMNSACLVTGFCVCRV